MLATLQWNGNVQAGKHICSGAHANNVKFEFLNLNLNLLPFV